MLCHRYYALRSMTKNDRLVNAEAHFPRRALVWKCCPTVSLTPAMQLVASAGIFLACKVDDSPRALWDVAYTSTKAKFNNKPDELARLEAAHSGQDLVGWPPTSVHNTPRQLCLCEDHGWVVLGGVQEESKGEANCPTCRTAGAGIP